MGVWAIPGLRKRGAGRPGLRKEALQGSLGVKNGGSGVWERQEEASEGPRHKKKVESGGWEGQERVPGVDIGAGGSLWGLSCPRQGRSTGNVPWTPLGTACPVSGLGPSLAVCLRGDTSSPGCGYWGH